MESYKQEDSFEEQRFQESTKYERDEFPNDLEQEILSLRNIIIDSFLNHKQDQFFDSIIKLNQIFRDCEALSLNIIKVIWTPQLGNSLLESIRYFNNFGLGETSPKHVSDNLLIIAKLLKLNEVRLFYSKSSLVDEIMKLLHSFNDADIVEQTVHVLIKSIEFFDEKEFPFDEIYSFFLKFKNTIKYKKIDELDEIFEWPDTFETYVTRCMKQIIICQDLSKFIKKKKICDLFYFIILKPKSERSIKHIMISIHYLLRMDCINLIFESGIIQQFMKYLESQESIYHTCPCYMIPFFEFIFSVVYYGDYKPIAKIFKIVDNRFFIDFFSINKSNPQIQRLILRICNKRLSKLFCFKDEDRINEIESITNIFTSIIKKFDDVEFESKVSIINFTDTLLEYNVDMTFNFLMENLDVFIEQFSYFVFLSDDDELFNIYIHSLLTVYEIAQKKEKYNVHIFLDHFCPDQYQQLSDIINSGNLKSDTLMNANQFYEKITIDINKIAEENSD